MLSNAKDKSMRTVIFFNEKYWTIKRNGNERCRNAHVKNTKLRNCNEAINRHAKVSGYEHYCFHAN